MRRLGVGGVDENARDYAVNWPESVCRCLILRNLLNLEAKAKVK